MLGHPAVLFGVYDGVVSGLPESRVSRAVTEEIQRTQGTGGSSSTGLGGGGATGQPVTRKPHLMTTKGMLDKARKCREKVFAGHTDRYDTDP